MLWRAWLSGKEGIAVLLNLNSKPIFAGIGDENCEIEVGNIRVMFLMMLEF